MTSTSVTTAPKIASTPGCWESFTSGVSSCMQKVAEAASKLWAMIKNGFNSCISAITPHFNKAVAWVKGNQQTAAIGAGVAAVAGAAGIYYCCCRGEATPAADPKAKKAKGSVEA